MLKCLGQPTVVYFLILLFCFLDNSAAGAEEERIASNTQPVSVFADSITKYLPPAEDGHAITRGYSYLAYPIAIIVFLLCVCLLVACIWFGLIFLIITSLLGSIGFLIYGVNYGVFTTWEQLLVCSLYLALGNALLIVPLRALLPQK